MRNFVSVPRVSFGMRLVLALVLALALTPRPADACECVARSLAQHAKAEKRVFLARAGKPIQTGDALKQKFTVLATFKGPRQAEFLHDRPATPPCATSYTDGEVAILFTTGGDLDPCHGNVPLDEQLEHVPSILAAAGARGKPLIDAGALEHALRAELVPYLHARPRIAITYAPLAGTTFTIDKSRLAVVKKAAAKHAIAVDHAFTVGDIAYVSGRYRREGLSFAMLLVRARDGSWSVLRSQAVES